MEDSWTFIGWAVGWTAGILLSILVPVLTFTLVLKSLRPGGWLHRLVSR